MEQQFPNKKKKNQSLCNTLEKVTTEKNKTQLGNEVSSLPNYSIQQAFVGQPEFFI